MASLIKKVILLIVFPAICYAGEINVASFGGGLNTQDSPAAIDPTQAQDLLNVAALPGGNGLFKRDGYAYFGLANPGHTNHGGYHFQRTNGDDVQIWAADQNVSAFVNDAPSVALIGYGTVGAAWQCTDTQGNAYCFSSANDTPFKTDGTVTNTSSLSLNGSMAAMTPTRLLVAGVIGNLSTIYYSQQNNFNNFTTGVLTSDAGTEIIAAPGSRITHLAYYFGKWFWWKDSSFGYITGDDQFSLAITIVSNTVGTLDNSDAFWNAGAYTSEKSGAPSSSAAGSIYGGIYFRGQDNHFYLYDGYSLTRLSRSITPTVLTANRRKANLYQANTTAGFNSGRYVNTTSTITANAVVLQTNNTNLNDNSFESGTGCSTTIPNWTAVNGTYTIYSQSTCQWSNWVAQSGTNYTIQASNVSSPYNLIATLLTSSGAVISSQTITAGVVGWTLSAPLYSAGYIGTVAQVKFSNDQNSTYLISDTFLLSGDITFYYRYDVVSGFKSWGIDNILNGRSSILSGTYYSPVINASSLTSWGTFSALTSGNGGTQTFLTRSSTSFFSIASSTPSWVAQSNNAIVSASTGTYFQIADTFTVTAATYTPALTGYTINWYEGSAADKSYITYYDDKIWFSVSQGTSTTNNRIYIWDLLNQGWFIYDIPCNGFAVENNILYIGDSSSANIYRYGSVPSDNGNAINSYWRSKTFIGTDPYVQNEFNQADFITAASTPTNLSYTYTLDTSSSTTFYIPLGSTTNSIVKRGFLLPKGKTGTFYDFKVGDYSTNPKWTVLSHKVVYNPLNWNPQNQ